MVKIERLIIEILIKLTEVEPNIDQQKVREILQISLDQYKIEEKETSLALRNNIMEYVNFFLVTRKIDGLSEATLKEYQIKLRVFSEWVPLNIDQIKANDIRKFLFDYQRERGLKKNSLNTYQTVLKTFFNWLEEEEYIERSPARKLNNIKTEKRIRKALTQEQVEKLRVDGCITLRQKALFEFILSTGARISEIQQLDTSNISWAEKKVRVIGKGNKEREIYFSEKAKLHLQKYIESRPSKEEPIFISSRKPYARLSVRSLQNEIAQIGKNASLDQPLYPHLLRHTMATIAYLSGVPLPIIQELLGHSDPSTTQIYAELDKNTIKEAHRRFINI